jgi:ABC-2 type transport system ATP-binding protein
LCDVVVDYGRFRALDGVTLSLPRGATGLVGRNGAGKSTLLRLLLGLVRATQGVGRILGVDLARLGAEVRQRIGYMPENDALVLGLSGLEQVVLAGELCGLPPAMAARRAHEVIAYTGLGEARYRRVESFSAGMRQRLKLAVALVHDPEFLLLDEPTVGLDPPGRRRMLELVRDLVVRHRKSVLLCTHLLGDIESVCDHVAILDAGRVLRYGAIDEIKSNRPHRYRLAWEGEDERVVAGLRAAGVAVHEAEAGEAIVECSPAQRARGTAPLFAAAHAAGARLWKVEPDEEELADLYHRLLSVGAPREKATRDG